MATEVDSTIDSQINTEFSPHIREPTIVNLGIAGHSNESRLSADTCVRRPVSDTLVAVIIIAAFLFPSLLLGDVPHVSQDDSRFYLENSVLGIAILRSNGGIDSIVHKTSGVDLRSIRSASPKNWQMQLRQPDGSELPINNNFSDRFTAVLNSGTDEASLDLTWTGLYSTGVRFPNASVHARISMRSDSQFSYWTIEAQGLGTLPVTQLNYPLVSGIGSLGANGADDLLLYPTRRGELFHDPVKNLASLGPIYPSGLMNAQFAAFFDQTAGFYIASDDTQGNTKAFFWHTNPAGDHGLEALNWTTGIAMDHYVLPYQLIVGPTQGDWYAPAEIYRSWTRQQTWTQQSLKKQTPAWLLNSGLMRNECAHGCGSQPDVVYADIVRNFAASQSYYGPSVLELFGWEKLGAWFYGDYFPPAEGFTNFDALLHALPPSRSYLFMSPVFLDTHTDLWKGGTLQTSVMLDQAGNPQIVANPEPGRTWAYMEIGQPDWMKSVTDSAVTLASHGVDLIQLDAFPQTGPTDCYSPSHGHPLGKGGNWQANAWQGALPKIIAAARAVKPDVAISGESLAEPYLPYFDMNSESEDQFEVTFPNDYASGAEVVPLAHYLFHDLILFNDFISPSVLNSSYFRLQLARDVTWGQIPVYQIQPGITDTPADTDSRSYLKAAVDARTTYAKDYLVSGTMLPGISLSVPTTTVSWIVFSQSNQQVSGQFPAIQHSEWRGSDGTTGIVLTNITTQTVTATIPLQFERLQLDRSLSYVVQLTDGASTSMLSSGLASDTSFQVEVPSLKVLLLKILPLPPGVATCTYGLSMSGQAFAASGGTGSITIATQTGCPWSVGTLPAGVTLTSAGSGIGSGTVTFQVVANAGGDVSTSFTIAGQTFTVEQEAASIAGLSSAGSLGQVASEGTWDFSLIGINLGASAATVRFSFAADNGSPLMLPLTFPQLAPAAGPELAATFDRTLAPNAQIVMESTGPDSAPTLIGSGQLQSNGNVSGFGIFSNPKPHWNAVVPLETRSATKYILAFDNTSPLTTGVAVASLAAQATNVTVIVKDDTGTQIGTNATISLKALGHTSFMLNAPPAGFPATTGKRGTIEFDTPPGGQLSVLGLRANGPALTTLPVLTNVDAGGGSITHVAFNGGWTSVFYIVNTGNASAQFTLSFFDENGVALAVPLLLPQSQTSTTTAALTRTLAPGAMLVVETQAEGAPAPVIGSAQVTTTGNISGFEIFRWDTFGQEASMPLETRTPNSFVLVFDDTNGLTTGVALASTFRLPVNITATFRDDSGAQLGAPQLIALAARGHTSFLLPNRFQAAAGKRGMVEFAAPQGAGLSVIGLRAKSDGTLTTIPVLTK